MKYVPETLYEKITKYDFSVVFISLILCTIGLFNIYSATGTSTVAGVQGLFTKQVISVGIGVALMAIFVMVDYRKLGHLPYILYGVSILLLLVVLVMGRSAYGAKRWISIGFLNLQPSEFAKFSTILALARYFTNDINVEGYSLRDLLVPAIIVAVPAGLIVIQPDLGSGLLLLISVFSLFVFLKIKKSGLIILAVIASITIPLVYNFALKDYQRKRVLTFIDPTLDPKGAGYNSLQSKIAVGSGRLVGKGYMKGTQTHLNFLPEHHTDFIFSVLAEEHGFVGSFILLLLYSLLFLSGIRIASRAGDKMGVIIAVGFTAMLFWQAFINIGMVMGIMPVVGVTLPFMSYGGSSVIMSFAVVGILQSISIRRYMF